MVGDIDFIFSKEDYPKAIKLLKNNNYSELKKNEYVFPVSNHYIALQKVNSIASVEIHSEILEKEKHRKEFNFSFVEKDSQIIDKIRVLSFANKLNLSIIADQINDNGYCYKRMNLRNAYDVFLLSKKTSAKDAMNKLDKLKYPLNCFLAACHEVFNRVDSLEYNNTKMTASYLNVFNSQFTKPVLKRIRDKRISIYLFISSRLNILYKSLIYKEYRVWLFRRLTDKNRY